MSCHECCDIIFHELEVRSDDDDQTGYNVLPEGVYVDNNHTYFKNS